MLQSLDADFPSMPGARPQMDVQKLPASTPSLVTPLRGDQAHRVAHRRWLNAALAHVCALAVLVVAASLDMMSFTHLAWTALATATAHGLVWVLIGKKRALPRHDPAMNVPLGVIALAALLNLAFSDGTHQLQVLTAAAPFLVLASCHLRRVAASWMGAVMLTMLALALMTLSHAVGDTHAVTWALLVLTAIAGIGLHSGVAGFAKRIRLSVMDTWIRSADRQQRVFMLRYLVGAFNCVVGVAVLNLGLHYGICHDPQVVFWLTCLAAIVIAVFYAILRSGLNRRFADPSMTEYQIMAAVAFLAVGYWLASTRGEGVALLMLVTILMFGMFSITPSKVGRCSVFGLMSFGVAMLVVASTDHQAGTVVLQWIHFGVLVVVLPTIYILASQLAQLRSSLRQRKDALAEALVRIEALATRDELTGLPNRRDMVAQLAVQQQRAKRSGKSFCVCMVDIDHFKQVNDVHGHSVGDDVLKAFASAAKASLRDTDVIARWGGEEFLVMLPDAEGTMSRLAIERMHQAMRGALMSEKVPDLAVTFSAGLVRCEPGADMDMTIERADRALYRAKFEGRDRTIFE